MAEVGTAWALSLASGVSLPRAAAQAAWARPEPAALARRGATYPGTIIEGTLGLPGVIQEVVTVELQQDPPRPRSEVSWAVGQPTPWNKNRLGVTQGEETETGVGGKVPSAPSASAQPPAAPDAAPARPGLGFGLRAFARPQTRPAAPSLTCRACGVRELVQHQGQGPASTHAPRERRTGPRWPPQFLPPAGCPSRIPD